MNQLICHIDKLKTSYQKVKCHLVITGETDENLCCSFNKNGVGDTMEERKRKGEMHCSKNCKQQRSIFWPKAIFEGSVQKVKIIHETKKRGTFIYYIYRNYKSVKQNHRFCNNIWMNTWINDVTDLEVQLSTISANFYNTEEHRQ